MEIVNLNEINPKDLNRDYRDLMKTTFPENEAVQRDDDYFLKKHIQNPFGKSIGSCLYDDSRLVGMYLFLRWQLWHNGKITNALQNVDAAIHPSYRGGLNFGRLYKAALGQIQDNTFMFGFPVEEFKSGYLKFGWKQLQSYQKRIYVTKLVSLLNIKLYKTKNHKAISGNHSFGKVSENDIDNYLSSYKSESANKVMTNWNVEGLKWRLSLDQDLSIEIIQDSSTVHGIIFYKLLRDESFTRLSIYNSISLKNDKKYMSKFLKKLIDEKSVNEVSYVSANDDHFNNNFVKIGSKTQNFIYDWCNNTETDEQEISERFSPSLLSLDRLVSD